MYTLLLETTGIFGSVNLPLTNPALSLFLSNISNPVALMMTKGPEELKQALDNDPELLEIVGKLNAILGGPPPSS